MSAIGGIYYFDERSIDRTLLIKLAQKLATHGPDGGSEVVADSVGIVYRAFHTNRESRLEKQPFATPAGHILAWDGRLDNRDELISLLRDDLTDNQTDVAVVTLSYLKWGIDFLARLVGDFALSLWDPTSKTLVLARDVVGPRPLHYYANNEEVVWSSELTPLLDLIKNAPEINDEYVAGYLTRGPEPGLTPYKAIHAVPPGFSVVVRNGQLQIKRFWAFDTTREIRYQTDEEYEEHFRYLFREAVRCRLRVDGPVWASLSGGLDSSAIVSMADEILECGEAQSSRLETVSYVYDEATSSDERRFISCVEKKRGRTGYHLSDSDHPPLKTFPLQSEHSFPDFLDCFFDRHWGLCEAMRRDGARVILTGHGGDELLCSGPIPAPELGDLLLQFRPLLLHRALKEWSAALKRPYLQLLWRDGMLPLLPLRIKVACGLKPAVKLPTWFDENFLQRMKLPERNYGLKDVFGFRTLTGRDQAIGFLSVIRAISKASYRARGRIEASHPYLHRPLVEFLQAIPFRQRLCPGETRRLMRRALKNVLPEEVLNRKSKKGPDEALFRAVRRQWPTLKSTFENPCVGHCGYIDTSALKDALLRARHGCETYPFALIQTISLEFWLRALERRSSLLQNTATTGVAVQLQQ